MLFDWLVVGQVLAVNLAHAVRGPKHVVKRGTTPVLTEKQARRLLEGIEVVRKTKMPGTDAETPSVVGLRDRALIAVMTCSLARIGAAVAMRFEDYYPGGKRWWLRLHEKGAQRHEMPVHHKLELYLDMAGIRGDGKSSTLTATAMIRVQEPARLPGDRHHRLPRARRHARKRPGDGRAREPAHHQARRPHRRPDHARRGREDPDLASLKTPIGRGVAGILTRRRYHPIIWT
jgi:hypothetical protein